jgi:tyrosyl-tRNA synthetase
MLVKAGFAKSKSEARQAIQQGGVTFDGEKITDPRTTFAPADLGEGKMLRKGKKNFVKVIAG